MKKLFNLFTIALVGILATGMISCKDEVSVNASPTSLEFDAAGVAADGASVKVTGSAWSATSGDEWITITPASGVDGGSFTVSVTANTDVAARTGSVTVASTDGDASQIITVSQSAPVFDVAITSLEFDAEGLAAEGASVKVTGSGWDAASSDEWITVAPVSGADGEEFTVSVAVNEDAARSGSVKVTSTNGETKTVNVSQAAPVIVAVTGVVLDAEKGHLILTDETKITMTLTATVEPAEATNQAISWSSGDDTVATVVDGVVTAVAPGNTVITVTTADGGFPDECAITVTEFGFIIADSNLPSKMGWDAAQTACPEGWRIPDGEELQCMCRTYHSEGDGTYPQWPIDSAYWSSDTAQGLMGETGAVVNFYTLTDPDCKLTGAMMNTQMMYVRCIQDVE